MASAPRTEAFPIDAAQLVALFMESLLYGFGHSFRALVWADGRFKPLRSLNWKLGVAALLMFLFASLDVAFHLRHNLDAFIFYDGDPVDAFHDTSDWVYVMAMACYVAQTFVGDGILIYRCWIIYGKNWLIIIPSILLWLGCTVCGVANIKIQATIDTAGDLLNNSSLVPFITSMLCLTLAMNLLTTGLVVFRIVSIQRKLKRTSVIHLDNPLSRVVVVMVQSGLMYTTSVVILFILYMADHNAQYDVSAAVVQIIGITFNLVITSVDRREFQGSSSAPSQNAPPLPMHKIKIHTSVSRYPSDGHHPGDDFDADKPSSFDAKNSRSFNPDGMP